ncbi:hypothetical protein SODALDRAFT_331166 [Sodiomyces alkalinus F11]|uniref:Uncharacterized protein n=1 Tax=Sodiomyces alkalinus (strain CBS 110278 / VKM F-3762 / F11) TaxID=1314773 RepID=A0A3N2Q3W1_SODAK|nr:hypothetical protein SODALDRAFT_331166 [Sodiomyces alkalinus F11]ROT41443.1 hypothetical protein SODALDRAFT_331166 [Sodiomyces alkalinus F11]
MSGIKGKQKEDNPWELRMDLGQGWFLVHFSRFSFIISLLVFQCTVHGNMGLKDS